jgi:hypothetical protein
MVRRIAALACALLVSCVTTVGGGPDLVAVCCVEREITFERPWGPEEDMAIWDVGLGSGSVVGDISGAKCRLSDGIWRCDNPAYNGLSRAAGHARGLARSTTIHLQEQLLDGQGDTPGNAIITRNGIPLFAGPVPGSNAGCADLGRRVHTLTIPPPPTSTP